MPDEIAAYFSEQEEWISSNVAAFPSDPFWVSVGLITQQYDGLLDGYLTTALSDVSGGRGGEGGGEGREGGGGGGRGPDRTHNFSQFRSTRSTTRVEWSGTFS